MNSASQTTEMTQSLPVTARKSRTALLGGFTLIELLVSLAAGSVLAAGLVTALYISGNALSTEAKPALKSLQAQRILHDLAADLHLALNFMERTPTAITFSVPDRDGDYANETIRYAWSGTPGDPLTYSYNGDVVTLAEDVQTFDLAALTRLMLADPFTAPESSGIAYEEFTEAKRSTIGTDLWIDTPPGYSEGDLLIAAVATDGNSATSLAAPAGWNQLTVTGNAAFGARVTFGVWWKLATSTEPSSHRFNWSPSEEAYGWIMRFSGQDPANPINATSLQSGNYTSPIPSPTVTSTVDDCLIVRLAALDGMISAVDNPGLAGHTAITADRTNGSGAVSGGAGFVIQETAGSSGSAAYGFPGYYVSFTIAVAPEVTE